MQMAAPPSDESLSARVWSWFVAIFGRRSEWSAQILIPILSALWCWYFFVYRPKIEQKKYAAFLRSLPTPPDHRTPRVDLFAQRRVVYRFHSHLPLTTASSTGAPRRLPPLQIIENCSGRPLGTVVWDGAIVLGWYVDDSAFGFDASYWHGKRVLELGSGVGLVGMLLAQRGAIVECTDLEIILPLLRQNINANQPAAATTNSAAPARDSKSDVSVFGNDSIGASDSKSESYPFRCTARVLEWGVKPTDQKDASASATATYDVLIGADVLYVDEPVFVALLDSMLQLTQTGSVIYLSGAKRHTYEAAYLTRLRTHFRIESMDDAVARITAACALRRAAAATADAVEASYRLRNPASACYILKLTRK